MFWLSLCGSLGVYTTLGCVGMLVKVVLGSFSCPQGTLDLSSANIYINVKLCNMMIEIQTIEGG